MKVRIFFFMLLLACNAKDPAEKKGNKGAQSSGDSSKQSEDGKSAGIATDECVDIPANIAGCEERVDITDLKPIEEEIWIECVLTSPYQIDDNLMSGRFTCLFTTIFTETVISAAVPETLDIVDSVENPERKEGEAFELFVTVSETTSELMKKKLEKLHFSVTYTDGRTGETVTKTVPIVNPVI